MKFNWNTVYEAIKLTITVFVYSWAKELPPEQDIQIVGSLIDLSVALASALLTLFVLNAVFGLPVIRVEWVVNQQTPRSDRPELTGLRNGVFFRYSVEAETGLSKFVLWILRKFEIEAHLSFVPDSNLRLVKQYSDAASRQVDESIVTKFSSALRPGNSFDGEFSLRLRQGRTVDTPVDCSFTLCPSGQSEQNVFAKIVCQLVKADTVIKGFLLKGGS